MTGMDPVRAESNKY